LSTAADTTGATAAPEIEARGIEKSFSGVAALRGVDLQLFHSEALGLIGENGAGKSTLLNVFAGAHQPDEGTLLVGGEEVSFKAPQAALAAGIATVHQQNWLVPAFSALRNVELGREPTHTPAKWLSRRPAPGAVEALELVGLGDRVNAEVGGLSLAERQLVAVARATAVGNRVLIFDEPTASLSPRETEVLFEVIERLRQGGVAIIYVTHRLEELGQITSRIAVLRDGKKVAERPSSLPTSEMVALMAGSEALEHEEKERTEHRRKVPPIKREDSDPALVVEGLSGGKGAFADVDMAVAPGETVGLVGLPDSGVEQFIDTLAGAAHPSAGTLRIEGRKVHYRSPGGAIRNGVGFLPGDRAQKGVIPSFDVQKSASLSALRTVETGGLLSRRKEAKQMRELLLECDVRASSFKIPITSLSGGNQQKALLARLLAPQPRIILCQEPTAGVDIAGREGLYDLIAEACQRGCAVVWQTSDLRELTVVCDRVVAFWRGRVAGELTADQLSVGRLVHAQFNELGETDAPVRDGAGTTTTKER
jgi:ABC-type sugar transport system ATPase subunit